MYARDFSSRDIRYTQGVPWKSDNALTFVLYTIILIFFIIVTIQRYNLNILNLINIFRKFKRENSNFRTVQKKKKNQNCHFVCLNIRKILVVISFTHV